MAETSALRVLEHSPDDGRSKDLVSLRALNEYVYCPRLHHLMYVQGIFLDNADTVTGSAQHRRAEKRRVKRISTRREAAEVVKNEPPPWPELPRQLDLGDSVLGLVGKLDSIRQEDGQYVPVETKKGTIPSIGIHFQIEGIAVKDGAWPGDQIQLCAQGMLLAANGYPSQFGLLYYRGSRKTIRVDFDDALKDAVQRVRDRVKEARENPMPAPLIDSPKCIRCSLAPVCLPEETNLLLRRIDEPRRVIPGRDDAGCVYVVTQGARIGLSSESLIVSMPDDSPQRRVPLKDVASVMIMGNVQISTQALRALMETGRPITFSTLGGRLIGNATGLASKNVSLRVLQFQTAQDPARALQIARGIVAAKITNQRILIRRNRADPGAALDDLARRIDGARAAPDIDSLMGEEGMAARVYFEAFPGLLTGDPALGSQMEGRNRRPPRDPVNALLSFGYALLLKDTITACAAAGFDPMVGYLHAIRPGRASLALDLMEPFRPLVVDSTVIRVINTGGIQSAHFDRTPASVLLTPAGRRAFLRFYQQRLDEIVTHPTFQYRMSYRRMLELEARLLGRFLEGELPAYTPLTTR